MCILIQSKYPTIQNPFLNFLNFAMAFRFGYYQGKLGVLEIEVRRKGDKKESKAVLRRKGLANTAVGCGCGCGTLNSEKKNLKLQAMP